MKKRKQGTRRGSSEPSSHANSIGMGMRGGSSGRSSDAAGGEARAFSRRTSHQDHPLPLKSWERRLPEAGTTEYMSQKNWIYEFAVLEPRVGDVSCVVIKTVEVDQALAYICPIQCLTLNSSSGFSQHILLPIECAWERSSSLSRISLISRTNAWHELHPES